LETDVDLEVDKVFDAVGDGASGDEGGDGVEEEIVVCGEGAGVAEAEEGAEYG